MKGNKAIKLQASNTYVLNVWLYLFQAPLLFGLEKFVEPDQAMSLIEEGPAHKRRCAQIHTNM